MEETAKSLSSVQEKIPIYDLWSFLEEMLSRRGERGCRMNCHSQKLCGSDIWLPKCRGPCPSCIGAPPASEGRTLFMGLPVLCLLSSCTGLPIHLPDHGLCLLTGPLFPLVTLRSTDPPPTWQPGQSFKKYKLNPITLSHPSSALLLGGAASLPFESYLHMFFLPPSPPWTHFFSSLRPYILYMFVNYYICSI